MLLCMPDTRYLPPSPSSTPLVMSQVCHSWRAVALAETRLWTSIAISITERNAVSAGLLATAWLARAGTRPLRISLSLYGDAITSQHMDAIFAVYRSSAYWQDAKLYLPMRALQPPAELINHNFPMLEYLSLAPGEDYHTENFPISTFQCAPRLRKIALERDFEADFYTLPLHQITHLDVNIMLSIDDCLPLLEMCVVLEQCSINIISPALVETSSVVTLRALWMLSIYTDQDLSEFLDHLTLPALRVLEIRHDFETANIVWPQEELRSLIGRSGCSLQRLLLSEVRMADVNLSALLLLAPKLAELEIDSHGPQPYVTDDVLRSLTPTGSRECVGLEMEVLKLTGDFSFDHGVFFTMIESRWRDETVKRLRELKLCLMDDLAPEVLIKLQQYRDQGLALSFS
ncbi:hypothetical protein HWV62_41669 [Athelia sp. TMB]|nr:hypothetical protein HWV62_41669 [Athelia sp. TMB]